MVSCFANINRELDVLITQQQLKDFISKYQISVREDITENYYWDKLSLIYSEPNQEISTEDFNNIFEITYEDSDPQSSNGSYFSSSKKTVEFIHWSQFWLKWMVTLTLIPILLMLITL